MTSLAFILLVYLRLFLLACGHMTDNTLQSAHLNSSEPGALPPVTQASPSLEPEEAEDATNAHLFLEDLCDGHASVNEFLSSLVTDAGHE